MLDAGRQNSLGVAALGAERQEDRPYWSLTVEETIQALETDAVRGLTQEEASRRLGIYGRNELLGEPPEPLWRRYWGQLTGDAVVRLLLIGGIASLLLGDWLEGFAILIMLNIMAGFGLWQEGKATDAARSLRKLDVVPKLVVRDGTQVEVPAEEVVPGDIVYLGNGSIAPADGRIIAAVNAQKDTSSLTGESMGVGVSLDLQPPTTVETAARNMIHRSNAVVRGNLRYVVTATGSNSMIGKIAGSLAITEESPTPLDEQLEELGDAMTKVFIWIAVIVIGFGVLRSLLSPSEELVQGGGVGHLDFSSLSAFGQSPLVVILREAFINAVALIIAAIPEGLPAVLTITLAIATRIMVRKNALIRKMKAVEGGGSMTVLLSDKTGTLTANQMEVTQLFVNGRIFDIRDIGTDTKSRDPVINRAIQVARLCNNSADPTEGAMLRWVNQVGLEPIGDVVRDRAREHEFDQSLKRMTTVHPREDSALYDLFTKGAPEQVLTLCHTIHLNGQDIPLDAEQAAKVKAVIEELASRGLRIIALADRVAHEGHILERADAEAELTLVGILGIMDPPREDVAPAVATLAKAGIRTVMVTGDNPLTAYEIARQVGIIERNLPFEQAVITGEELANLQNPTPEFMERLHTVRVFARVTPQHKAEIVRVMKEAGFIVGMTGDGVNDAIALKESDVGFAMGNGTDVAREASDLVLMDSRFGTIPSAVEEGRNVLHRIRLYLSYILSGNGCEVGAFIVAYILGFPIPLTALVLLIINFATDSFPALAMAFEPGEQDVMEQPPRRRDTPFINRPMWIHIGVQTVVASVVIMAVYYYYYDVVGASLEVARAAAFMTYISQKLYRAFTARSLTRNVWEIGLFRNRWSIAAVLVSLAIALFFTYVPGANTLVGLAPLSPSILLIVALVGLVPPIAEEITKLLLNKGQTRPASEASPSLGSA